MTNVDSSTSDSLAAASSSSSSTPKIFRLKRKIDDDPLSTFALAVKKSKKSSDVKIEPDCQSNVVYDVLHLAASSSCPIAPEYLNVDYHDLNIIHTNGMITDMDLPSSGDDQDLFKIDPQLDQSSSSLKRCQKSSENVNNTITCNGRPMQKIKKKKREDSDYVYDFYVPKSYNVFKDGLPDKITCRIDTENLIDGVISLNAFDQFDDPNNAGFYDDQHFPSLYLNHNESSNHSTSSYFDPYYYRNERDIDRMYDSNLSKNENNVRISDFFDYRRRIEADLDDDEDEDSNDENNYKNEYPDEDNFSDGEDVEHFDKVGNGDGEEEDENFDNYLDDGDTDLMSKFDDFYLENY